MVKRHIMYCKWSPGLYCIICIWSAYHLHVPVCSSIQGANYGITEQNGPKKQKSQWLGAKDKVTWKMVATLKWVAGRIGCNGIAKKPSTWLNFTMAFSFHNFPQISGSLKFSSSVDTIWYGLQLGRSYGSPLWKRRNDTNEERGPANLWGMKNCCRKHRKAMQYLCNICSTSFPRTPNMFQIWFCVCATPALQTAWTRGLPGLQQCESNEEAVTSHWHKILLPALLLLSSTVRLVNQIMPKFQSSTQLGVINVSSLHPERCNGAIWLYHCVSKQ